MYITNNNYNFIQPTSYKNSIACNRVCIENHTFKGIRGISTARTNISKEALNKYVMLHPEENLEDIAKAFSTYAHMISNLIKLYDIAYVSKHLKKKAPSVEEVAKYIEQHPQDNIYDIAKFFHINEATIGIMIRENGIKYIRKNSKAPQTINVVQHEANNELPNKIVKVRSKVGLERQCLSNEKRYMEERELRTMLWEMNRYKACLPNDMLFKILNTSPVLKGTKLYSEIIKKLHGFSGINYNSIEDNYGNLYFTNVINKQDEMLLKIVSKQVLLYNPQYDIAYNKLKAGDFKDKLAGIKMQFPLLAKAFLKKSLKDVEIIKEEFKSPFYNRNISGQYMLNSMLKTNDKDYVIHCVKTYKQYLPNNAEEQVGKYFI